MNSLEFFGLVHQRHSSVDSLHSKHLVIALLIIEHRSSEIFEDILCREGSVRLENGSMKVGKSIGRNPTWIHSCQMKNL